jgi:hypothetical protein
MSYTVKTKFVTAPSLNVISGSGATVTLTQAQSGSEILLDRAAGIAFTLPAATAANIGVTYSFFSTVSLTSGSNSIVTGVATDYFYGSINGHKSAAADVIYTAVAADVRTTVTFPFTTVTAGIVGSWFSVTCTAASQWIISGVSNLSGTTATPFS